MDVAHRVDVLHEDAARVGRHALAPLYRFVKDRIRLKSDAAIEFDKTTTPTPLQQRALDLLGVSLTL